MNQILKFLGIGEKSTDPDHTLRTIADRVLPAGMPGHLATADAASKTDIALQEREDSLPLSGPEKATLRQHRQIVRDCISRHMLRESIARALSVQASDLADAETERKAAGKAIERLQGEATKVQAELTKTRDRLEALEQARASADATLDAQISAAQGALREVIARGGSEAEEDAAAEQVQRLADERVASKGRNEAETLRLQQYRELVEAAQAKIDQLQAQLVEQEQRLAKAITTMHEVEIDRAAGDYLMRLAEMAFAAGNGHAAASSLLQAVGNLNVAVGDARRLWVMVGKSGQPGQPGLMSVGRHLVEAVRLLCTAPPSVETLRSVPKPDAWGLVPLVASLSAAAQPAMPEATQLAPDRKVLGRTN
ncbi:hypothetical protein [Rubrivivax sp. JA1026]|uniref:hypothetical protein n=1 Tax=Rubrivivax sp. JA1026 TaxID=2710888 RepID=UPI0013E93280|nr:hypothetical protein [Rubrivivax sp. JA1026]